MRKNLSYYILFLLSALPFLITWLTLPYFPHTIPTHYDFSGNPDTFSAKNSEYVLAIVFSLSGVFMLILALLINKFHPDNKKSSTKASTNAILIAKCGIAMMLLFLLIQCCELMNVYFYVNHKGNFPDLKITNIALMLLLIYIGALMSTSKKNFVFGIRTSFTMKTDTTWAASQKSGGIALILSSLIFLIISLFLPEIYQLLLLFIAPVSIVICTLFFSYKSVQNLKDKDNI